MAGDDEALKTGTRPEPRAPSGSSGHSAGSAPKAVSRARTTSQPGDGRFSPGEVLAERFRIVGLLGRGGMGEVYRADDLRLGQPVALKFLPESFAADQDRLDRFYNEVRVARQVSHPNVCRMFDIGEADGLHYLAMEFVDGDDLASLLRRIGRLPEDKGLDIARQLCAGLAAAHDRSVLHRDLKPENIMIDGRGKVRITDFGLASVEAEIQGGDIRSGTPAYMSPEQLSGREVTVRSDIYSLGLVLYEIFTGKRAFEGKTFVEFLRKHENDAPLEPSRIVANIDTAIESAVLRCLAKDPRARPSSALAVSGSLPGADPLTAALMAGQTPSPEMVAAAGGGDLPSPWLIRGSALLTAAIVLAIVFFGLHDNIIKFVPMEKPPAVLEDRAREILKTLGAPAEFGDQALGYSFDTDYLLDVMKRDQSMGRWDHLRSNQPPVLKFWYRESPRPLHTLNIAGVVFERNPPIEVSGMAGVWLDTNGRLTEFYRVPPQRDSQPSTPPPTADYSKLFELSQIDPSVFKETTPEWMPAFGFDERKAWLGEYPLLKGRTIRIEAASYRGKPVWFKTIGDWTRAGRMETYKPNTQQNLGQMLTLLLFISLIVFSGFKARSNLLAGRGDRRGAVTITIASIALGSLIWLLRAHHLSEFANEFQLAVTGFADVLLQALFFATLYLALEPFIRRRHPEMLISWTRLLSRRITDPLVASHAVIGTAAGAVFGIGISPAVWTLLGIPSVPGGLIDAVLGSANAVAPLLARVQQAVGIGLGTLLLLIGMELIVKNLWVAGALTVLAISAREALAGQAPWLPVLILMSFLFSVAVFTLLRYGVVAFVFSLIAVNTIGTYPFSEHLGAWYSTPTRVALGYFALVIWWGLRYGSGGSGATRSRP
jgi:hypothetical protein